MVLVHILSPETDNCPSWINGRQNDWRKYSRANLHAKMMPDPAGIETATSWSPVVGQTLPYTLIQWYNLGFPKGRTLRKRVFRHMRTAKAQISLRIRAVRSGPSLSAIRIIGYYIMFKCRAIARMKLCACAGCCVHPHILHMLKSTMRLTQPTYCKRCKPWSGCSLRGLLFF